MISRQVTLAITLAISLAVSLAVTLAIKEVQHAYRMLRNDEIKAAIELRKAELIATKMIP